MDGGSESAPPQRCDATGHNDTGNSSPHTPQTINHLARCDKSSISNANTAVYSTTSGSGAAVVVAEASKTITPEAPTSLNEVHERRNWLIYHLYTRQEYAECNGIIEAQLQESKGLCEYALYVKGMLTRRNGQLTESLNLFQSAMRVNPQNPDNQKQVGESFLLLGQHRLAIESFQEAQQLRLLTGGGEDWKIHYSIGMCHMHLQEYHQAENALARSISIRPHDSTVMQLGKVLVLRGDYKRAIDLYTDALQASPENQELLTTLGLLHLQAGDPAKAFHYVGKCLTLNASNPKAIMVAASIMQENSEFGVALNKYRVAIAKLPFSARLWSNIGMCFLGRKNLHAAVSCLKKAVSLAPFEWRIVYNMGLVFMHTRQYASASPYLSAAAQLHKEYAPTFMNLGVCLAMMNDIENACAAYERALSIVSDPLIRLNYCISLVNFGQKEKALEHFEFFMRSSEHAREKLQSEWGSVVIQTVDLLSSLLLHSKQTHSLPIDNLVNKNSDGDADSEEPAVAAVMHREEDDKGGQSA